ncbi:hypothetical protein [Pseudomonas citronellolis]|uniref:hypothetical protein n=1 Tax=Pseudomonas citronellolis TaxID=53408 RepID=UPI0023E3DCA9|nr:hypothetical protein [Pseudomonas citronellolis]MDF3932913.1 hypothetical protein [Pseudomonas citronellolis]
MNVRTLLFLGLSTLAIAPALSTPTFAANAPSAATALDTRLALRELWLEHIFWIRDYAQANQAGDSRQAKVAAEQVVANATAIANSIAPLYGQPAADQLLTLLAGHWGAVRHYSDASVAKDAAGRKAAVGELQSNAAAIARFLATANPNLPENDLLGMLGAHGAQHIAQIDQLAAHDYAGEARTWQAMRAHILMLSDALASALVKQFPDKFAAR